MAKILKKSLSNYAFRKPRLKDFKLTLGLLLPLFLIICLVYPISAQFQTVKIYDRTTDINTDSFLKKDFNSKYGIIKLSKTFLWIPTDKIAEYSLIENTEKCFEDCYAIGKVIIYEDTILFENIKFNILGTKETTTFNYNYYLYLNTSYKANEKIISLVCKQEKDNKTQEFVEVCKKEITGTKEVTKYKEDWVKYNNEILKPDKYRWKLVAKKPKELSVDWIVEQKGIEFKEWAEWTTADCYAIGGNITINGDYCVHTFLVNGSFDLYEQITNASVLVVAGGGSGGGYFGGGGGAGGLIYQTGVNISVNTSVTVGIGGIGDNGKGTNGTNSTFGTLDAMGGGGGGIGGGLDTRPAQKGGSGGGGGATTLIKDGAEGYNGQGKFGGNSTGSGSGYAGGGGGGASENGTSAVALTSAGHGGNGTAYTIYNGTTIYYAGGGGGCKTLLATGDGNGGSGGGGAGGVMSSASGDWISNGEAGQSNTGGGGGGGYVDSTTPSNNAGGSGIVIISYKIEGKDSDPLITMVSPNNYANFSYDGHILWCRAIDDRGNLNLTMYINGVLNETVTNSTGNQTLEIDNTIYNGEGLHNWTCMANDGTNIVNSTRYYTTDTTSPVITFNKPNGTYTTFSLPINITLNYTVQDLTLSNCYYNTNDNSTITMFTCNTTTNITFYSAGNKTVYYYANDTLGHETNGSSNFLINYITSSIKYNSTAIENEKTLITYYVNTTYLINNSATLVYNGTSYNMSYSLNGNNITFYYNLTAPNVNENTNYSFYINYSINGNNYDTTIYYQLVYNFTSMVISTSPCTPAGYKFSLYSEQNQTKLEGATIDYNFKYGFSNNTLKEIYGTLSNVTDFYLCINDTINPYWNIGYGEIEYVVDGFVTRRYYIFSGTRLTNTTVNILLYDLATPLSTEFLITTQSTNLIPFVNHYITLLRWYPENNSYAVVDMGKTDDKGQTILKVQTVDVDYRIGIYETDGTLIQLINPLRMICQTDPCVYSLYVDAFDLDLTLINDIQQNLSYNSNTKIFTFIWNDPSQQSQTMNLTVYKMGALSTEIVCSTSSTSYTGVMLCDVSAYTGQLKAVVTRTSSPEINIASLIVNIKSTIVDAGGGVFGLFIGAILVIFFALIGAFNPIIVVIFGIMALIPLYLIGNITWEILMAIGVLGGVVIHFLRRTTL